MWVSLGLPQYTKCLRVHGKKVFRKILESLRLTFNGRLKTLHNEKLHYLNFHQLLLLVVVAAAIVVVVVVVISSSSS